MVLKADRLSSVRWKDILDVHCTDRVTVVDLVSLWVMSTEISVDIAVDTR